LETSYFILLRNVYSIWYSATGHPEYFV